MTGYDAALEDAKRRLDRGESDLRGVTGKGKPSPTPVTSVRVSREVFGVTKITITVACEVCGGDFVPTRADAKVCSGRCRQRAYRSRRA